MIQTAFDTILNSTLEVKTSLICILLSLAYGFILALIYKFNKKSTGFQSDIPLSIMIYPLAVCAIVLVSRIIGLNSAADRTTLAFGFAGVLALTRFRSTQHDITDLSFLFVSIILGFLNGLGYVLLSFIVLLISSATIILVSFSKFNAPSSKQMSLKVVVPESLNFDNIFDDILKNNCKSYNLKSIKSTEFGTMFELNYIIVLHKDCKMHDFLDMIREKNGNLNVTLSVRRYNSTIVD